MTLFHHLSYLVLHFALFIPFQLFQLFMLFQLLHHTKLSQQCSSASSGTGTHFISFKAVHYDSHLNPFHCLHYIFIFHPFPTLQTIHTPSAASSQKLKPVICQLFNIQHSHNFLRYRLLKFLTVFNIQSSLHLFQAQFTIGSYHCLTHIHTQM